MTPLFKPLLGIGLVGGGVGLSVGGCYLLKESDPKTLAEKFKKENVTILDYEATTASSENGWSGKLDTYKTINNSKIFSDISNVSEDLFNKLKTRCKESLKKSLEEIKSTEGLETKVREWCTTAKAT